jgi:hypothetical protein
MTEREWLDALRSATAAANIAVLRARILPVLRALKPEYLGDNAVRRELRAALRRLKAERPDPEPSCECGHELGWHDHGLLCQKCDKCAVFRPADVQPLPARETHPARDRLADERRWWAYWNSLPPETRQELVSAGVVKLGQHATGSTKRPATPWEQRLAERREKLQRERDAMRSAEVEPLPPGVSLNVGAEQNRRSQQERRDFWNNFLTNPLPDINFDDE